MTALFKCFAVAALMCSLAAVCRADIVDLGLFSLSTIAPGPGGIVGFDIENETGTSAMSPDFPVLDNVTLLSSKITLSFDNAPASPTCDAITVSGDCVINLGDIGPSPFTIPASIQFADNITFKSALLEGMLSSTSFLISPTQLFTAASADVSFDLLPGGGTDLIPFDLGGDFVLLTTTGTVSPVSSTIPEPSTVSLFITAIFLVMATKFRRFRRT